MVINIRPVERRDAAQLAALLGQLGYPTDVDAVNERLDYLLVDPASYLLGAEAGGELVGVVALHVIPMLEMTGRLGRLLALVVDDRYRGRGVGRTLMTAIEQRARDAGCDVLEVSSSRRREAAQRFYRGVGYDDICGTKARFVKTL